MKGKINVEELGANSINAQYIFVDIVEFTLNKTIESQFFIIDKLNWIVIEILSQYDIFPPRKVILLPTGDGLCIALRDRKDPYDLSIKIAMKILKGVNQHNKKAKDVRKQFQLRIGINENQDLLYKDINGKLNIAGSGINLAQRIMNIGDSSQIMISERIYSKLSQYDDYSNCFKLWLAHVKHNVIIPCYQYKNSKLLYLNNSIPFQFRYQPGISLYLNGRSWIKLPDITAPNTKGKVVVDIIVDKIGKVISAIPGGVGSTTNDSSLYKIAKEATLSTTFNKISNLETQKGTITFNFV